ncbi:type II toxin-antitoxin system VapB family antitoxin [Agromyces mangrovi Wang et al. 2018]|uniref:type II toxin-antitoxin system VapB family antitoxin n=1 Tax=Agromyces mangrovi TaxID=1858653 RepID=UPI002573324A|nr:type II toxin-antitoxin system VapB family antitoxin [Agromyces mangrovi]
MTRASVFRTNRTQAVRLPKEVALPDDVRAVDVTVVGDARILTPVGGAIDFWFDHGVTVTDDFLAERDQGEQERPGL